jgi:hypothetical protein
MEEQKVKILKHIQRKKIWKHTGGRVTRRPAPHDETFGILDCDL